jgi:hypothetical protein
LSKWRIETLQSEMILNSSIHKKIAKKIASRLDSTRRQCSIINRRQLHSSSLGKGQPQPSTVRKLEEVPMKLNDTITTYDVAEALQGETGKFEVTSPNGERYFVTCQSGHSIASLEWAGSEPNLQPFLVRKVAQPVAQEGRTRRSAAA